MILMLTGCGLKAGGGSLNDLAPNDPQISQGAFSGQNGQTVTGTAILYSADPSNPLSYIVRLDGLTMTAQSASNLNLVIDIGGTRVTFAALRGTSGSQNYSYVASSSSTVNSIVITNAATQQDFATATLLH